MLAPNPRKTKGVRRLGPVDIAALKAAVAAMPPELWDLENAGKPNRFDALGGATHVVFRFVASLQDWRDSYDRPLWAEWRPLLEPVLAQASAPYGYARGAFPRVMLARLPAGAQIKPHQDNMPAARWPHKVHVPLFTNDKVIFYIDGIGYHLPEGEAAEVNNMGVHAVTNGGDTERVHLIFEYYDLDQPAPVAA
jgi:hypothetical protein